MELVKEKRITDAFRRFSKSLKLLIGIEPINPEIIDEDSLQQMVDMKVWVTYVSATSKLEFDL